MNTKPSTGTVLGLAIALAFLIPPVTKAASTVTFDNQSGKAALVKLVGPTASSVSVENNKRESASVAPGHYFIKVRYGIQGAYSYSKGDEFDVKGTATIASDITITLHKVVAGNYGAKPISEKEFGGDAVADKPAAPAARDSSPTNPGTVGANAERVRELLDQMNTRSGSAVEEAARKLRSLGSDDKSLVPILIQTLNDSKVSLTAKFIACCLLMRMGSGAADAAPHLLKVSTNTNNPEVLVTWSSIALKSVAPDIQQKWECMLFDGKLYTEEDLKWVSRTFVLLRSFGDVHVTPDGWGDFGTKSNNRLGLPVDELVRLYGEPDSKETGKADGASGARTATIYRYGRLGVEINDGKVVVDRMGLPYPLWQMLADYTGEEATNDMSAAKFNDLPRLRAKRDAK